MKMLPLNNLIVLPGVPFGLWEHKYFQMKEVTRHYTKDDLTVVWQSGLCRHSTICWKGLIEVFNPQKSPWINMEGADKERIIEQVKKCPSGALSYILNKEK